MKQQPLVSILMTVYNREKYIAEAIESVINSTYQNWELIIVDDRSADKSVEIARRYESTNSRIKVYLNDANKGQFENRNHASSYAKGKYIKYLDSDDIIYPHGLQTMVDAMEKFAEAGVGCIYEHFDDSSLLPIFMNTYETIKIHFFEKALLFMGPSACIYRTDFFNQINKFDANYKVAADYEFNIRAALIKPTVLFNRDLIWWRQHAEQEFINSNRENDYIILNYKIHKNLIPNYFNYPLKSKILTNNEILMGRRLLKMLVKLQFNNVIKICKQTKFPLKYLIRALLPAKKL